MQVGQVDSIESLDIFISGFLNGAAGTCFTFNKPLTNVVIKLPTPS